MPHPFDDYSLEQPQRERPLRIFLLSAVLMFSLIGFTQCLSAGDESSGTLVSSSQP